MTAEDIRGEQIRREMSRRGLSMDDGPEQPNMADSMAQAAIPAYGAFKAMKPALKSMGDAYNAVKEPLAGAIQRTAPIPAFLTMMGDTELKQPNPLGPMLPAGMGNMLPPIKASGMERGKQVAGAGADALLTAGIEGAAVKGIPKMAEVAGDSFNAMKRTPSFFKDLGEGIGNVTKNELPFVEKMASDFKGAERGLGTKFGSQLDDLVSKNPNNVGSSGEALANMKESMALNPHLRALINSRDTPATYRLLSHPDIAEQMNAKEMQNVINELQGQTTQRKLAGLGIRPHDSPFIGIIHDFRDAQLSAFPEMAPIRQEFRTGKEAVKNLRPYFKEKVLPRTIRGKMDENVILMRDAKRLLPEESVKDLKNAQMASRYARYGKEVGKKALLTLPFGGAALAYAKLTGRAK